jgi:predicted nucleic acid-binding protein
MDRLIEGEWGVALLPEYVFLETVTVLLVRRSLSVAVEVGEILLRAREVEFIPGSDIFVEAWAIFRSQKKTTLSFADAAILGVARRRKAEAIATFDRTLARLSGKEIVP